MCVEGCCLVVCGMVCGVCGALSLVSLVFGEVFFAGSASLHYWFTVATIHLPFVINYGKCTGSPYMLIG